MDKMTVLYSRVHRPPTVATNTTHTLIPRLFALHARAKSVPEIPMWGSALKWTSVVPGARGREIKMRRIFVKHHFTSLSSSVWGVCMGGKRGRTTRC